MRRTCSPAAEAARRHCGVLAMKPEVILMDEPTAMLDPSGRREVQETVERLP